MLFYIILSVLFILIILIIIYSIYKNIIHNNSIKLYGSAMNDIKYNDKNNITKIEDINYKIEDDNEKQYIILNNISNYIIDIIINNKNIDIETLYKLIKNIIGFYINKLSLNYKEILINKFINILIKKINTYEINKTNILKNKFLYTELFLIYSCILKEYYVSNYRNILKFLNTLLSFDIIKYLNTADIIIYYDIFIKELHNITLFLTLYNDINEIELIDNLILTLFYKFYEYEIIINNYYNNNDDLINKYDYLSLNIISICDDFDIKNKHKNINDIDILFNILKDIKFINDDYHTTTLINIIESCYKLIYQIIINNKIIINKDTRTYKDFEKYEDYLMFEIGFDNKTIIKYIEIENNNFNCLYHHLYKFIEFIKINKNDICYDLINILLENLLLIYQFIHNIKYINIIHDLLKEMFYTITNNKDNILTFSSKIIKYNNIIDNYCNYIEEYYYKINNDYPTDEYINNIKNKYIISL